MSERYTDEEIKSLAAFHQPGTTVNRLVEQLAESEKREAELRKQVDLLLYADTCKGKQVLEFGEEVNRRGGEIEALREERNRLLDALKFYANSDNWIGDTIVFDDSLPHLDGGFIAQRALAAPKESAVKAISPPATRVVC